MCSSLVINHLLVDLEMTCILAILVDIQEPNQDSIHNNNNNLLVDLEITCILAILVE